MTNELEQDALADVVRSLLSPRAPRYGLDYGDWAGDDDE